MVGEVLRKFLERELEQLRVKCKWKCPICVMYPCLYSPVSFEQESYSLPSHADILPLPYAIKLLQDETFAVFANWKSCENFKQ